MRKIITRNLCLYMLIGMVAAIMAIFGILTFTTQRSNTQRSIEKLDTVRERLESNQAEIDSLIESLGENNLAKARAFADIIAADPSFMSDPVRLNALKEELMVSELNVIDENGIITHSTVDAYIGFDMASGEQSAAFLAVIEDPAIELVQEPQENTADGSLMQYVGVARRDVGGCVQVGIRAEILEQTLAGNAIDVVLGGIDFGDTGYIYAIDLETGLIEAHPVQEFIGNPAKEAGLPVSAGSGRARVGGVSGHYVSEEYDGRLIGTFLPSGEYYESRLSQTLVVSISLLAVFILLLVLINRMVDQKIVSGIRRISDAMGLIAKGDYSVRVDEKGNPEFMMLSTGINKVVESMRSNLNENERLLKAQKQDMENNYALIDSVKNVCANLNNISNETLDSARSILGGTQEQEIVVNDLKEIMAGLADGLNDSADATATGAELVRQTVNTMQQGREQIQQMEQAIQKINDTSLQIEKIIGEINAIAGQTNMLSLNASIEAARAGDSGRGFAVVAVQVGELAARSAAMAKETNDLITTAIEAVEDGRSVTDRTVKIFDSMTEEIEKASEGVNQIADTVRRNVSVVTQAANGLERISDVVKRNVEISRGSEQTSITMAEEAGNLMQMVGS